MNDKRKKKNVFNKLLDMPIYVTVSVMTAILCLFVFIALKGIDVYTNHNEAVVVPDVRKLQIEEAAPFFKAKMLKYVLVDSVYRDTIPPGAIVELMPEANSRVKKNRTIRITVNARSEKKIAVPDVKDISYREAWAILVSRGFTNLESKYELGEYRDLAMGVRYGGKKDFVASGTRLPQSAKLILVIGDGNKFSNQGDSISINRSSAETDGDKSLF